MSRRPYALAPGLLQSAAAELAGEELASLPEEVHAQAAEEEPIRPDGEELKAICEALRWWERNL